MDITYINVSNPSPLLYLWCNDHVLRSLMYPLLIIIVSKSIHMQVQGLNKHSELAPCI